MSTPHRAIPLDSLQVAPDRQRRTFTPADLFELADSIRQHGLFHALLVRKDGSTLVAGERRFRAIREHLQTPIRYAGETLPAGHVPVIEVDTDDPLALEEIELHENIRRKDLTWQETADAHERLHRLRTTRAAAAGDVAPTTASTAQVIHGSLATLGEQARVRQEIIVAKHLDNPEVAKAASVKDAFKVIKRQEEAARVERLAAIVGETYSTAQLQAFNVNCLEWMDSPEAESRFDVILTDPPYGMGADTFGDGAGRVAGIEHHYDDSYESWQVLMRAWCPLSYRVTKPQAHAYIWCDIDRFHELKALMQAAGWYVFRTPLTNYKRNSGRVPLPTMGPRRQSEWCLYAIKGDKPVTAIYSDVITTDADEQLSHGAQKPVALYTDLLRRSVRPGDTILDSFAGTGPLFPAAFAARCTAIGLEQNPVYYGLCVERIQALGKEPELPL